ncbi:MAG: hypothetical protein MK008_04465 [Bdellovibrionales bacterium]|nr:hypothetical protein [Bdellovibrionales bacterium]
MLQQININLFILTILIIQSGCSVWNAKNIKQSPIENTKILKPVPAANCRAGDVRKGYLQPIVNGLERCTTTSQTCQKGHWMGPVLYTTCENPTEFCDSNHPHGSVQTGFTSLSAPCIQTSRTCIDGKWSGPKLHKFCN